MVSSSPEIDQNFNVMIMAHEDDQDDDQDGRVADELHEGLPHENEIHDG